MKFISKKKNNQNWAVIKKIEEYLIIKQYNYCFNNMIIIIDKKNNESNRFKLLYTRV